MFLNSMLLLQHHNEGHKNGSITKKYVSRNPNTLGVLSTRGVLLTIVTRRVWRANEYQFVFLGALASVNLNSSEPRALLLQTGL